MRARTDIGAFITATLLAGALTVVAVGDGGGEPVDSATGRPISTSQITPGSLAPKTNQPEVSSIEEAFARGESTVDSYAVSGLKGGAVFLLVFLLGHLGLRKVGSGARWTYALLGALAAVVAIGSQTPLWGWRLQIGQGTLVRYLLTLSVFGSVIGFLYRWRAGLDEQDDDPAALERALKAQGATPASEALIATDNAEYFAGPLVVRTSIPVMFVASLIACGVTGLGFVVLGASYEITGGFEAGSIPLREAIGDALHAQLFTIGVMGIVAPAPIAVLVMIGHHIVRGLGKTSYLAYAVTGALISFPVAIIISPLALFIALKAMIPLAVAMSIYRSMAGMEPKAVAEDVIVRDRRNLVGANHPRRQFGRVVKG